MSSSNIFNFVNEIVIECGVCNYVFPNFQAFVTHIEAHLIQEILAMEVSPIDGTKPFIKLLDKPILSNVFFDDHDDLDLSLKL
ncbi:unnamed protein product [Sphenostylis stenocarpa]|uniref:C2H2-type domain-containing protein n=1 Tax=Sphenostylis stenocarpa TaxID=92480 RepID=A0AA86SV62_9FABA|nr:unnamed protein product [Sphenostylis stenocarpa]